MPLRKIVVMPDLSLPLWCTINRVQSNGRYRESNLEDTELDLFCEGTPEQNSGALQFPYRKEIPTAMSKQDRVNVCAARAAPAER